MSSDDAADASEVEEARTWPELAISLYDRLTGRGTTITYEFEEMEIDVPNKVGEEADYAHWRVDGTLKIATDEDE